MPLPRLTRHRRRASVLVVLVACSSLAVGGCRRPAERTYPLEGQIVSIDQARQEMTVKHGDIAGFMPAMTMAYKIRDPAIQTRTPGELIKATLVVEGSSAYLRSIERVGVAPLPTPAAPPTRVMDIVNAGQPVRDAELTDENGRRRSLKDWRGQVIAVTFVYTRCPLPDFCPLIDRQFAAVQEQVRAAADLRGHVRLLSVTLDPEYDTPEVLERHAAALHVDPAVWSLLTGPRGEVETFASQFGVSVIRETTAPSELVHNLRTAVIDGDGKLVEILSGAEWQVAQLLAGIRNARARG
jgi:protein SCO1